MLCVVEFKSLTLAFILLFSCVSLLSTVVILSVTIFILSAIAWSVSSGAGVQSVALFPFSNLIKAISTIAELSLNKKCILSLALALLHTKVYDILWKLSVQALLIT